MPIRLPIMKITQWQAMACALLLSACAQQPATMDGPLTIAKQGSFFVGGKSIQSDALSTLPAYAPSGTIAVEQMYVHYQVPGAPAGKPTALIHGCCLAGSACE